MQFTPRRSLGGSAWISVKLASVDEEKTLVLWANTAIGFLLHWWHANKQQAGRGRIGVAPLETLPVLDIGALTAAQVSKAAKIFDAFCDAALLPLNKIDTDIVRHQIDKRFGCEVLNLPQNLFAPDGPVDLLRRKLAAEPSIRGSKNET